MIFIVTRRHYIVKTLRPPQRVIPNQQVEIVLDEGTGLGNNDIPLRHLRPARNTGKLEVGDAIEEWEDLSNDGTSIGGSRIELQIGIEKFGSSLDELSVDNSSTKINPVTASHSRKESRR